MPASISHFRTIFLLAIVWSVAACGDSTAPDDSASLSVSGTWAGVARLPNGYTAGMTLQQSGSAISGTMRISGSFIDRPVAGAVDASSRALVWQVLRDCEVWSGVLSIDAAGDAMTGPVQIDRRGCAPAQSSGSGTLSLTR